MTPKQIRDSKRMIREAWPHRHTHPLRARTIIRCNIAALRRAS